MKIEMPGNLALPVAVLFNSVDDLLVPLARVVQNPLGEDGIEPWSVGESLTFGDLRDMVAFVEMVCVAVNKFVVAKENLTFDLSPDCFLVDSPGNELAVFFHRLGLRPAELTENPVRGQTGYLVGSGLWSWY